MTETPLVFLDTETTGVHPGREVWEVAMIRREGDNESETQFFVDVDLSVADPFGLSIGCFYERHPWGMYLAGNNSVDWDDSLVKSRYEAAEIVAHRTHGAHIVGAVPNFDTEVLDRLLRAHGLIPAWHYHLVDVETLAAGVLGLRPPWNFDKVLDEFGLTYDEKDRHTALGDARMARALYDAVMARKAADNG
jgi:DNA polymerase III epsilon subunit-like protein